MSISADCSYEEENPSDPSNPITITISGEATWPDVSPPYTRKGMRCGIGYNQEYARRFGSSGLSRFYINAEISSDPAYPLDVVYSDGGFPKKAGFFWGFTLTPAFVSGFYKPEDTNDPFYACGFGAWSKSTEVTKGIIPIITEERGIVAIGKYPRIEPGGQITYYKDFDYSAVVGTGTMNYKLTIL